jgi:hypothetical protein
MWVRNGIFIQYYDELNTSKCQSATRILNAVIMCPVRVACPSITFSEHKHIINTSQMQSVCKFLCRPVAFPLKSKYLPQGRVMGYSVTHCCFLRMRQKFPYKTFVRQTSVSNSGCRCYILLPLLSIRIFKLNNWGIVVFSSRGTRISLLSTTSTTTPKPFWPPTQCPPMILFPGWC